MFFVQRNLDRVASLPQLIDVDQQLDVLLHNQRVLLLVTILIFLEVLTEIVKRDFLLLAELLLLLMDIGVADFVLAAFFFHVDFVQVHDTFLELFVVAEVVQAVVDILLELSLVAFLLVSVLLKLL